jgi:hypothetical protein
MMSIFIKNISTTGTFPPFLKISFLFSKKNKTIRVNAWLASPPAGSRGVGLLEWVRPYEHHNPSTYKAID